MKSSKSPQSSFWQKHIERQSASDLSRSAYCKQQGLKLHQLNYQIKRFQGEARKSSDAFARVLVRDQALDPITTISARLELANGVRIEFRSDADPVWVGRLIQQVGGLA